MNFEPPLIRTIFLSPWDFELTGFNCREHRTIGSTKPLRQILLTNKPATKLALAHCKNKKLFYAFVKCPAFGDFFDGHLNMLQMSEPLWYKMIKSSRVNRFSAGSLTSSRSANACCCFLKIRIVESDISYRGVSIFWFPIFSIVFSWPFLIPWHAEIFKNITQYYTKFMN